LPDFGPQKRASRSSHLSIDLQKELTKDCSFHPMFWPFWHCSPALRLNIELICIWGRAGIGVDGAGRDLIQQLRLDVQQDPSSFFLECPHNCSYERFISD
jgi:hypothetical protein